MDHFQALFNSSHPPFFPPSQEGGNEYTGVVGKPFGFLGETIEMKTLINVLRTELLKMKRTLSFWLAIIAPLAIAGLEFLVMWAQGEDMLEFADGSIWLWHSKFIQTLWALLLLPLFVTLETALHAGLEHSNGTWKQLFAQPVPRWMIIATKQFSGLVLIGI